MSDSAAFHSLGEHALFDTFRSGPGTAEVTHGFGDGECALNLGVDNMAIFDIPGLFLTKQYRPGSSTLGVPSPFAGGGKANRLECY
jgi:hypothetical protein